MCFFFLVFLVTAGYLDCFQMVFFIVYMLYELSLPPDNEEQKEAKKSPLYTCCKRLHLCVHHCLIFYCH